MFLKRNLKNVQKQNRESTEGYSKSIVRKNDDKFGKRISLRNQIGLRTILLYD